MFGTAKSLIGHMWEATSASLIQLSRGAFGALSNIYLRSLTIFVKRFILDIWKDPKYVSVKALVKYFYCSRSSLRKCSIKTALLSNFAIFIGKHLCCSFFLIKLQAWRPATLLKRDSNASVFLCILRKFSIPLF